MLTRDCRLLLQLQHTHSLTLTVSLSHPFPCRDTDRTECSCYDAGEGEDQRTQHESAKSSFPRSIQLPVIKWLRRTKQESTNMTVDLKTLEEWVELFQPYWTLWRPAGNRTSNGQIRLEGCGPRPFLLAINGVNGTKGNTLL